MTVPIVFEVPALEEPVMLVREWAASLRDEISEAGENWPSQSDLEGQLRITVKVPKDEGLYYEALTLLVAVDMWCIRAARNRLLGHPPYPPVYEMACYAPDPEEKGRRIELWGSIESLYLRGVGDCEDLACARIAERVVVGDVCRPRIDTEYGDNGVVVHHILIENPDGTTEDPSLPLGMKLGEPHGDRTIARCRVRTRGPGGIGRQEARRRFW